MKKEIIGIATKQEENKGGRPRAFNTPEEMEKLINEYFEIKTKNVRKVILKDGQTVVEIPEPETVHIAGLCAYLEITDETLRQYQKKEGFSGSIMRAKQMCQSYAADMCFKGKNKADFVLMNNFGWKNRSEQENTGQGIVSITTVITEKELEEARKRLEKENEK